MLPFSLLQSGVPGGPIVCQMVLSCITWTGWAGFMARGLAAKIDSSRGHAMILERSKHDISIVNSGFLLQMLERYLSLADAGFPFSIPLSAPSAALSLDQVCIEPP